MKQPGQTKESVTNMVDDSAVNVLASILPHKGCSFFIATWCMIL